MTNKKEAHSANAEGPHEHTMPAEILSETKQHMKNTTWACNRWVTFNIIQGIIGIGATVPVDRPDMISS